MAQRAFISPSIHARSSHKNDKRLLSHYSLGFPCTYERQVLFFKQSRCNDRALIWAASEATTPHPASADNFFCNKYNKQVILIKHKLDKYESLRAFIKLIFKYNFVTYFLTEGYFNELF